MRKSFFLLLLSLEIESGFAQAVTQCNCDGLVDLKYRHAIPVYSKPYGQLKLNINQDFKNEDYLTFVIDKDSLNFFHISFGYSIKGGTFEGWVKKAGYLGTFSRVYHDTLKLFSSPEPGAFVKAIIPIPTNSLLPIMKCKGQWVYIKHKKREGWMRYEDQCPTPYTTCN